MTSYYIDYDDVKSVMHINIDIFLPALYHPNVIPGDDGFAAIRNAIILTRKLLTSVSK